MRGTLHNPTAQIEDNITVGAVDTNPSASDILANSGQLDAASYLIQINMWSEAATYFEIARRNAADSADTWEYLIPIPADTDVPFIFAGAITFAKNERIVVRANANVTGDVQALIKFDKISG